MPEVESITMYAPPGALPARFALENGYFGQTGFDRVLLQPYTDANDMSPLLQGQLTSSQPDGQQQRRQ